MGLITDHGAEVHSEAYEAVALDPAAGRDAAVFLRRSPRPSRRAVLHLHDLRGSFVPGDLARWYNERGFHFYVTDLVAGDADTPALRRQLALPAGFIALDAARAYLLQVAGIDAIILSAEGRAAGIAAQWCDARKAPVDALILSNPAFGRAKRMNISCPVLVISDVQLADRGRAAHRDLALGQHVTWLVFGEPRAGRTDLVAASEGRRRLFDEMGRWLGAYMYGQVRDQLL